MRHFIACFLLCSLIAIISCSDENKLKTDILDVNVSIVDSISHHDDSVFGRISGLALDGDRLYAMDASLGILYTMTHEFDVLDTFGRKGEGPGEFVNPGKIFLSDSLLYVAEVGSYDINVLSVGGEVSFLERKKTNGFSGVANSHITPIGDSLIYLGGRYFNEKVNLLVSTDGLVSFDAVKLKYTPNNPVWASTVATTLPGNRLLVAYRHLPYLEILSGTNVVQSRRLVYPDMDKAGAEIIGYGNPQAMLEATRNRPEEIIISDVTYADDGYIFVLLHEGKGTNIQVYDDDLTYLATFELPESAIGLRAVAGRYFFTISGDGTQLHKYTYEFHALEDRVVVEN